jgi:Fe-S-cluster containining protein
MVPRVGRAGPSITPGKDRACARFQTVGQDGAATTRGEFSLTFERILLDRLNLPFEGIFEVSTIPTLSEIATDSVGEDVPILPIELTGERNGPLSRPERVVSQMTSICQSCHAGCCRAYAVPITGADVLRLERATGLNFWDFACRWEDREGIISGDYAPQLFFDDEPLTPFVLCLLHQPSLLAPTTSKCRFLGESSPDSESPLGRARCLVYDNRPSACRVFPLQLHTSSPVAILSRVPAHGRPADGHEIYRLCSREWRPSDVDPIGAPQDLAVAEYETSFFKQVAAIWNQSPGSWLKFPEFLRLVYENRVCGPAELVEEEEAAAPVTLPFPVLPPLQRRVA